MRCDSIQNLPSRTASGVYDRADLAMYLLRHRNADRARVAAALGVEVHRVEYLYGAGLADLMDDLRTSMAHKLQAAMSDHGRQCGRLRGLTTQLRRNNERLKSRVSALQSNACRLDEKIECLIAAAFTKDEKVALLDVMQTQGLGFIEAVGCVVDRRKTLTRGDLV